VCSSDLNNSFENIKPVIIDNIGVQDIDNLNDWELAEMKYKIINNL
jgi:hypothetical protein